MILRPGPAERWIPSSLLYLLDRMPAPALPSALAELSRIETALAGRPAIFLDYDGTLTPIVPDPKAARIGDAERSILRTLARKVPVAIVSGRNLDDLQSLVAVEGLVYAGNHGWEIEGPGIELFRPPLDDQTKVALEQALAALADGTRHLAGVSVEQKRFAIAVHTRRAGPAERDAAVAKAVKAAEELDGLGLTLGKEIAELRPAVAWHKGRAVGHILDTFQPSRIPLYIGDDSTDEDAFAEVSLRHGIGVLVGPPALTQAGFRLADPGEVLAFITALEEHLAETG